MSRDDVFSPTHLAETGFALDQAQSGEHHPGNASLLLARLAAFEVGSNRFERGLLGWTWLLWLSYVADRVGVAWTGGRSLSEVLAGDCWLGVVVWGVLALLIAGHTWPRAVRGILRDLWLHRVVERDAEGYLAFVTQFEAALHSRWRWALTLPVALLWAAMGAVADPLSAPARWAAAFAVERAALAGLLGYAAAVCVWQALMIVRYVRQVGIALPVRVRPFDPGGCGGLRPVGDVSFWLAAVAVVAGMPLFGWVLWGVALYPTAPITSGGAFPLWVLAVGGLVLAAVIFVCPQQGAHRALVVRRQTLVEMLTGLRDEIHSIETALHAERDTMSAGVRRQLLDELATLEQMYVRYARLPRWPVGKWVWLALAALLAGPMVAVMVPVILWLAGGG